MSTAGIRELRQNLSRYIDRVKLGETIEVTEHGRLVAALVPRGAPDVLADLEAAGLHIRRPQIPWASLGPTPHAEPGQEPLTEVLARERADERY